MSTAKCEIEFSKFCKVYAQQNQKTNLIHLYNHLVETIALILHSKVAFKTRFWLKLSILKNALHALNSLIPHGNKRSHILTYFNKPTPFSCRFG